MLHVGLTGGIGSGKSSVGAMFADLGAVVLDADLIVRDLLAAGGEAVEPVCGAFGERVRAPSGEVDRKALAAIVFNDAGARRRLEAILHPLVLAVRRRSLAEIEGKRGADAVVVTEASLIFEAHTDKEFDVIVLVTTPEPERRARLSRAGWDPAEVDRRMRAQWPDSAKAPLADYVIRNEGRPERTRKRVEDLWTVLKERARAVR